MSLFTISSTTDYCQSDSVGWVGLYKTLEAAKAAVDNERQACAQEDGESAPGLDWEKFGESEIGAWWQARCDEYETRYEIVEHKDPA